MWTAVLLDSKLAARKVEWTAARTVVLSGSWAESWAGNSVESSAHWSVALKAWSLVALLGRRLGVLWAALTAKRTAARKGVCWADQLAVCLEGLMVLKSAGCWEILMVEHWGLWGNLMAVLMA